MMEIREIHRKQMKVKAKYCVWNVGETGAALCACHPGDKDAKAGRS